MQCNYLSNYSCVDHKHCRTMCTLNFTIKGLITSLTLRINTSNSDTWFCKHYKWKKYKQYYSPQNKTEQLLLAVTKATKDTSLAYYLHHIALKKQSRDHAEDNAINRPCENVQELVNTQISANKTTEFKGKWRSD